MRAIVIHEGGGPEVLRLEEVPDPVPGEGEVLVRVEAAAVNHYDVNQRRSPGGLQLPVIPGVDGAGTRVDTGERVLVTGTRGTYAELIAAPLSSVWPIADGIDAAHAAALGVAYKTAWGSLADGELKPGDTLLVQAGSSGTGQAAIDIGRHLGATVYATASASKHDRVRELGAEPLAYDDPRIEDLEAAVVFDPVGGETFGRSLRALAAGGRLVTPGAIDDPVVTVELWPLINKKQRIIGTGAARTTRDDFATIVELAGAGELHPVVDRELPLAEAAESHLLIETRAVFGKIVLRPDL